MKKYILLGMISCIPYSSHALDLDQVKSTLRNYSEKYLGDQTTVKIFGAKPQAVVAMPAVPKVIVDPTKVIDKTNALKDPVVNLSLDQRRHYNHIFVEELSMATRKSDINKNDLKGWLINLEEGGTREGLYRAMVLDSIYRGLENYPNRADEAQLEFVNGYLKKFVNLQLSKNSAGKINVYSLKKIATEKLLEVMDEYIYNGNEDFYAWYAHLSTDLATSHGHVYNGKLRPAKNTTFHYKWAKSVPIQYVKSEVIIKFNLALNDVLKI